MTSTAMVKRDEMMPAMRYSAEDVEALKATFFKGMTDAQAKLAVRQAERQGLDLFSGEAVTFATQGRTVLFTTIQGLRARAARSGRYLPGKTATAFVDDPSGKHPAQATVYVQVWDERTSTWLEVSDSADWREYGSSRGAWQTHGWTMLAKCAEAKCLRRCFPVEMSGMYISEEREAEEIPTTATYACEKCNASMSPTDVGIARKAYGRQVCAGCRQQQKAPAEAQGTVVDAPAQSQAPAAEQQGEPPSDPGKADDTAADPDPRDAQGPKEELTGMLATSQVTKAKFVLAARRTGAYDTLQGTTFPDISPLTDAQAQAILELVRQ